MPDLSGVFIIGAWLLITVFFIMVGCFVSIGWVIMYGGGGLPLLLPPAVLGAMGCFISWAWTRTWVG